MILTFLSGVVTTNRPAPPHNVGQVACGTGLVNASALDALRAKTLILRVFTFISCVLHAHVYKHCSALLHVVDWQILCQTQAAEKDESQHLDYRRPR